MALVPFDDRDGWIWLDGQFVAWRDAKLHVLSHGLHYASGVFEGERAYSGNIFKLREHTERLIASGRILGFEIPWTAEEIDAACIATLARNNQVDAYVRPIAWRGTEQLSVSAQQTKIHLAIATWAWPNLFGDNRMKGVRLGWAKDEKGTWRHPVALQRAKEDQEMLAKGCERQDLAWIDPKEFEQWRQGLWKCGDAWLDNAAADAYHADATRPWFVQSEHFVIAATVDRRRVEWCKWYADKTWPDLVRLFGVTPGTRPTVIDMLDDKKPGLVVLRDLAQYNKLAAGAESEGFSSLHYAFFADARFDDSVKPAAFDGFGAAYWDDTTKESSAFGQHAIRHAAAHSFVEAIDPSWKALGDVAMGTQARTMAPFWAEKKIPRWLRYGAASYVERWFLDPDVGEDGDPQWARKWARAALKKDGGLRDIAKVFEFKLTIADVPSSSRLIHEAGLLTAFVLDGGDKNVQRAHEALKQALVSGVPTAAAVAELQKALLAAKAAITAFAAK